MTRRTAPHGGYDSQGYERPQPDDPGTVQTAPVDPLAGLYGTRPTLVANMPGRICYAIGDPYEGIRVDLQSGPAATHAFVRGVPTDSEWARDLYNVDALAGRIGGQTVWTLPAKDLPPTLTPKGGTRVLRK